MKDKKVKRFRVKWDTKTLGGFTSPLLSEKKAEEMMARAKEFVKKNRYGLGGNVSNIRIEEEGR